MQVEKDLIESERKYRLLVENSCDIIYSINLKGYFTYANPVAERIMGWTRSEIVGKHYLIFVRPDFHDEIDAFYKKQHDEQIPNTYFEYPVITKDGQTKWIGQNVHLLIGNGKINGFHAVARDITDRRQAEEALRESERKYRLLAEKMTDIVWIMDMNLRTIYVSPSIEVVLGFSPEERMSQDVTEQLTPASMSVALEVLARELEIEQQGHGDIERNVTLELEYYHKDGSTRWIENIMSGIRNSGGVLTGLHGVSRDITDRRQAEEALRESEKRYRELVDFLPISLFEMDREGNVMTGNPAIFETFGYEREDLEKGINAIKIIIPEHTERLKMNIRKVLNGEKIGGSEYTGIRKNGSKIPLIAVTSPIIRGGNPVGLRGAIIDLTNQKRIEESLRKSTLSLAEAQRIAHIGNWEWDIESGDMYWSDEIYRIVGTSPQMFDGSYKAFFELVFPDDREIVKKAIEKSMKEGATSEIEHRIVRCDGVVCDVHQRVEPITDDNGRVIRVIGIIQDVTEKNWAERDLQNARDQLIQSEKLTSMGRLSAGVAHEILNPVSIIFMELQLLQNMQSLSPEVQEELKVCMDQISRIVTIAENLKQVSRIPEKKMIMADMNDIIARVLTLYATQLKIEGIETEVQYHPDLPVIAIDKEKIEQVILNLITNAVAAMEGKEKKVLRITVERETMFRNNDQLQIVIADTGTGIKGEHMSKIFDPFFTTKKQEKGTGLGLSISYGIIHDHGGKIWAENNEWGGASFYVRLPLQMAITENNE